MNVQELETKMNDTQAKARVMLADGVAADVVISFIVKWNKKHLEHYKLMNNL